MTTRSIIAIFIIFLCHSTKANNQHVIDSLNKIISTSNDEQSLCAAYNSLGEEIYLDKPDSATACFRRSLRLAELSIDNNPKMDPKRLRKAKVNLATALNNLGLMLSNKGRIEEALIISARCLKLQEELSDTIGIAMSLNNIAAIYNGQGDFENTVAYFKKSLELRTAMKDSFGIAMSLSNLGLVYQAHKEPKKGLKYNLLSLEIRERLDDKLGLATTINNVGQLYLYTGSPVQGQEFLERSLEIRRQINDLGGIAVSLNNLGRMHLNFKRPDLAMSYGLESLAIAKKIKYPDEIKSSALLLYHIYKRSDRWKEALEMKELHIQMRDSINNENTQKATIRQQTKYEFEKAQLVKEQEVKEAARLLAEKTARRDNLQYSIVLICLLVIGVLVALVGRLSLPERATEGIIFFAFLLFFEFLLVLADPYIEDWSGGAPGFKLLFNAGIAALIFPAHSFFESKLKRRLVKG